MSDLNKLLESLSPEKRKLLELQLKKKGSAFNTFPLSYAQRRLWFLEQLMPGNTAYNIPAAVRLEGRLDIPAVEESLQTIVQRHEVLRTTFTTVNGNPMQVIHRQMSIPLQVVDLSSLNGHHQQARLRQEMRRLAATAFSLQKGPLLRVTLFRLAPEEHVLFVVMHHIISDGWSVGVFIREFSELYAARLQKREPRLPELPIQYVDFAQWQRKWLSGENRKKQLDYWKQVLGEEPPVLELPTDRPRSPIRRYRGDCVEATFPAELVTRLHQFASEHQSTLFMTLLAAFYVLLFRYSGQEDMTVGTPIANRNREETENLIGFFVNTLVLRAQFAGHWSFEQLLDAVRQNALGAFSHQDLPFEMLVEELSPPRDTSHTPLFQVMFVHQNLPAQKFELPGLTLSPVKLETDATKFDLTLTVGENARGELLVNLEYDADLFHRETIQRMVQHYCHLLEAIVQNPQQPICQLPMLSPAEEEEIWKKLQPLDVSRDWSRLRPDRKRPHRSREFIDPVHRLIEIQAREHPDAVAIVFHEQQMTFGELDARANRLAHFLRQKGVGPDTLVGVSLPRTPDLIVALYAILKAGGAYVPIDLDYPLERKKYILEDAALSLVVTDSRINRSWPSTNAELIFLDQIEGELATFPDAAPDVSTDPEHLAYMIYTSGSTGRPKGTMITHRGLTHYLNWAVRVYPLDKGRGSLVHSTIAFDATVTAIFPALIMGRAIYLVPEGQEVEQLAAMLRTYRDFSLVKITPAHLELLEQQIPPEEAAGLTHALVIGGENLTYDRIAFWQRHAPETWIYNEYGPTETVVGCVVYRVPESEQAMGSVPIGQAIPGIRVYVLDAYLQPVPVGVPGELFIAGDGVARGYWKRPDLTAERFLPDPFASESGARMYRTGDLVRLRPDGQLEFLGRLDNQVKIRGYRIELGEIESVLQQHPDVREVVVLLREDVPGDRRLVAYVVPENNASLTQETLRDFLGQTLPDYMIPASFIFLEAFPLTPNGKIDRKALPAPDYATIVSETPYVAPRTPTEEIVARQMAAVLNLERVGVQDNFFNLGGHSLLATQLVSRINDAFDIQLPLTAVFEAPTVEGLARRITRLQLEEKGLEQLPIEPVPRDRELLLSFSQQRLWFLDQMEPESPFYNIPAAFRIRGNLDLDIFRRAVQEVVKRHEILRTRIETVDGRPRQVVLDHLPVDIPVEEFADLPESDRQAEVEKQGREIARQGFRLNEPPLFRIKILRFAPDDHAVIISMHHIISDGWSMGILVREIATHYQAFRDNRPSPLPPLSIQYADFAAWQHRWLESEVYQKQIQYWQEKLADSPPLLELPTDRPRPSVPSFRGDVYTFRIDGELTRKLMTLCQETDTTLFMTLLAAFAALLSRYSGQKDINIGTPIANRNRLEIEPLIGFFVNTLVLRTDLSGPVTFRKLLHRVRQTALEAYAHQDVPFEKIVDVLNIPRDVSHSPLFQVMFSLNNIRTEGQQFSELQITPVLLHSGTAKFDLTLEMNERGDGLDALVEYNTDLFDRETIAQMMNHFIRLLEGVVADP
ncbi:MAG: amino acid adenylation domain-containing protein, partial [Calditrichaeota bacterium]|nr:amino acid adenylation domain-containing protein [Calditrichota bacterium]